MTEGKTKVPKCGDVYLVHFEGAGSVQSGIRPGVVFQNNIGNTHSPNVVVLPLTTNLRRIRMPTHVFVDSSTTGLAMDSVVLCENPQCISKQQLGRYLTSLPASYLKQIAVASIVASGAISFLEPGTLTDVRRQFDSACTAS